MKYMTYSKIKKILSEGTHEVTFTKADGSKRVMKATLDREYLSQFEDYDPKAKPSEYVNEEVVKCMDTDIDQWRSFKVDSVTAIEK